MNLILTLSSLMWPESPALDSTELEGQGGRRGRAENGVR